MTWLRKYIYNPRMLNKYNLFILFLHPIEINQDCSETKQKKNQNTKANVKVLFARCDSQNIINIVSIILVYRKANRKVQINCSIKHIFYFKKIIKYHHSTFWFGFNIRFFSNIYFRSLCRVKTIKLNKHEDMCRKIYVHIYLLKKKCTVFVRERTYPA